MEMSMVNPHLSSSSGEEKNQHQNAGGHCITTAGSLLMPGFTGKSEDDLIQGKPAERSPLIWQRLLQRGWQLITLISKWEE